MCDLLVQRPAEIRDVDAILNLLDDYADQGLLLKRTRDDLLLRLKNFRVLELAGKVIGCLALRDFGDNLYEIRSLAVAGQYSGHGYGTQLICSALETLRQKRIGVRVFALTYRASLFCRAGFRIVNKELFPQKIWSDCSICAKKEHCDETAVLMEIPAE